MSEAATAPDLGINLFDAQLHQCPYPAYQRLRDEAPAYRQPGTNIYVVTRYDDVRRVLTDAETFPSSADGTGYERPTNNIERQRLVSARFAEKGWVPSPTDRKSTRLNSSHITPSRMPSSA